MCKTMHFRATMTKIVKFYHSIYINNNIVKILGKNLIGGEFNIKEIKNVNIR